MLDVNLTCAFLALKAAVPHLRARGGGFHRAHHPSINGMRGKFGQSNYAASKAGLIALTKTAARELGAFGIRVNAVAPGLVKTPMTDDLPEAVIQKALDEAALKRVTEAEDVAAAVLFLLSDGARQITRRDAARRRRSVHVGRTEAENIDVGYNGEGRRGCTARVRQHSRPRADDGRPRRHGALGQAHHRLLASGLPSAQAAGGHPRLAHHGLPRCRGGRTALWVPARSSVLRRVWRRRPGGDSRYDRRRPGAPACGIGRALFEQFKTNLRGVGIEKIQTQASWNQWELLRFLESSGFVPCPGFCCKRRFDFPSPPEVGLPMRRHRLSLALLLPAVLRDPSLPRGAGQAPRKIESRPWQRAPVSRYPPPSVAAHTDRWIRTLEEHGVEHMCTFASLPEEVPAVAEAVEHANGRLSGFALVNPRASGCAEGVERLVGEGRVPRRPALPGHASLRHLRQRE